MSNNKKESKLPQLGQSTITTYLLRSQSTKAIMKNKEEKENAGNDLSTILAKLNDLVADVKELRKKI